MRFDTRDKKPKLWNLAIIAGFLVLGITILTVSGIKDGVFISCVLIDLFILTAIVLLLKAFKGQLEYNPYSYNTIFYMGFAIFSAFVLVTYILLTISIINQPADYIADHIFSRLLNSATDYMFITFPFLFIFSLLLCISNISLIRHEGFRPVNLLGIILSFLLVGGVLFIFFYDFYFMGSYYELIIHELITNIFAAVYLYFECMLIGVIIANIIVVRYEPDKDKDFLIVLGCGLRKDGTPTPLLKGRLDRALAFYKKQKEETGKDLTFITSGGQGPDEAVSESLAMKRYLMEKGIPEDLIIEEDRSTSTHENMLFSKEKIMERNPDGKIAFSTTNYHVFRSGLFARYVKMRAVGMGARTKWYFWPNAAVREFVGLLTEHKIKQLIIFGSMILFYIVLIFLSYPL